MVSFPTSTGEIEFGEKAAAIPYANGPAVTAVAFRVEDSDALVAGCIHEAQARAIVEHLREVFGWVDLS
jgi:hypothetical protein